MSRFAYLTCELRARDLDSRLLIAKHLLEMGVSVVIGQQWSLFMSAPMAPKGVYLFKTANEGQANFMEYAKAKGHVVAAHDEEALAVVDPYALRLFVSPRALANADVFMFQNEEHRNALNGSGPIVGNARIDLLRTCRAIYEAEAAQCQAAGPYILINTTCTLSNNIWGSKEKALALAREGGAIESATAEGREYEQGWVEAENAAFRAFRHLLPLLPRSHRIVVRPHPSEKASRWEISKRVAVVSGTNPIPWLIGADVVVHSNSTTGLEGALVGTHCINLNPLPDLKFSRSFAMNNSPLQARSAQEAMTIIDDVLANGSPADNSWIPSFRADAAKAIADQISSKTLESGSIQQWNNVPRADAQKAKFTVSAADMALRLKAFGIHAPCQQIVDSVFLLGPN